MINIYTRRDITYISAKDKKENFAMENYLLDISMNNYQPISKFY